MNKRNFCKTLLLSTVCGALALSPLLFQDKAVPPLAEPGVKPKLYLIGDSTVNNGAKGQMGWGQAIGPLFNPAKIEVVNRARGGRSSRTFFTEGLWDKVVAELHPGDFVMMQFGHNDGGGQYTGARGRASIKGNSDEVKDVMHEDGKQETVRTYGWYLRRYIADTKSKGAVPIVLSPIPRNRWGTGTKVDRSTGDYGLWAKEAAKQGEAAFVDLNSIVADKYDAMGKEKVDPLFFGDWTHTSPEGAKFNAGAVVEGVKALDPNPLASYLMPEPG